MADKIILYGSKYGTTRRYAEELARRTGIPAVDFHSAQDASAYQTVIYIGALYAGGVEGLSKVARHTPDDGRRRWIIVTVGLSDPAEPSTMRDIESALRHQLPAGVYGHAAFYHLRGGIDYDALSPSHRVMMKLMYLSLKRTPPEKRSVSTRAMIGTYGQKVDFVDFSALEPITNCL